VKSTFGALEVRDFRVLWIGGLASFVAFFMAMIVQSVVAFQIAGNNKAVGRRQGIQAAFRTRVRVGTPPRPPLGGGDSPHETLLFYWANQLGAIREGSFKYHIRRPVSVGYALAPLMLQMPVGPWLFNLAMDSDESYDVSERHADITARLARLLGEQKARDLANPRGFLDGL
jgi:hypothetical protein